MKFVIQRVSKASVTVENNVIGKIGKGFLVLVGITHSDTKEIANAMIKKLINLRIFTDSQDKMNLSLKDVNGSLLLVSQFTLYADCSHGNRPGFTDAAKPDSANELYEYIAERVKSNVRELEGALSKIIAYAGISNKKIDIDLAEFALASIIPDEVKLTPQAIIEGVSDFYKIDVEDIKGPSRVKELVMPRHVAMYLCKTLTDMNFVTIAKVFGNRDRTSVMHGVDRIMKNIQTDSNLKAEIEFITKDLIPE